ncbi:hypothetical protein [Leptospira weilii]|uniref:Transglutaminase-like protein n=1 Tax=Leptospira weilii str. UI 13098 TaxID=1088542 RepID=M6QNI9_9LEPT|nr:hypothetical protein [Leptospira weilii]EMN90417.1 hypothetical protein LEP1GSC108_2810 [Leptospira weilii str. UI 13098]
MNSVFELLKKLPNVNSPAIQALLTHLEKNPERYKNLKPNLNPLESFEDTVSDVFRYAYQYPNDLGEYKNKSIYDLYNFVRSLPYHADPKGLETVSRFLYTRELDFPIRDCDDKTVPILAWAIFNKVPCRAVVCGEGERPHHIYPEVQISGVWYSADATYSNRCSFGMKLYGERFRKEYYLKDFIKKF